MRISQQFLEGAADDRLVLFPVRQKSTCIVALLDHEDRATGFFRLARGDFFNCCPVHKAPCAVGEGYAVLKPCLVMANQFIELFKSPTDAKRERLCLHIIQFDVLFDLIFFHDLFIDVHKISFGMSNMPGEVQTIKGGICDMAILRRGD